MGRTTSQSHRGILLMRHRRIVRSRSIVSMLWNLPDRYRNRAGLLLTALLAAGALRAETGYDAWLRYQRLPEQIALAALQATGFSVTLLGRSPVLLSARDEFLRGTRGML